MDNNFKETILAMSSSGSGRFQFGNRSIDYDKAITNGAIGRTGTNFYFFIYKDSFEKIPIYGAVCFLYKPLSLSRPFDINYKGDRILQNRWGFYTDAALYFLKKNFHDTIMIETAPHELQTLFHELEELTANYETKINAQQEQFQQYDFNVLDHGAKVSEVLLEQPTKKIIAPYTLEQLERLKPKEARQQDHQQDRKPGDAHLGLSLIVPSNSNPEPLKARFQPVVLPVKKKGAYGKAKHMTPSLLKKYNFPQTLPPAMQEYIDKSLQFDWKKTSQTGSIAAMGILYFAALAETILELPAELSFCQFTDTSDQFYPMKTITFNRLEIRFAPIFDGSSIRILPVVESQDGEVVEAGSDYQVIIMGHHQVFLFITTFEKEYVFAIPQNPDTLNQAFHFINSVKTISTDEFPLVRDGLMSIASPYLTIMPESLPLFNLDYLPTPVLKIMEKSGKRPERIEIEFDYTSALNTFLMENPHIRLLRYDKKKEFEEMSLFLLSKDPMLELCRIQDRHGNVTEMYFRFSSGDDLDWLLESSTQYLQKGFKIFSQRRHQFIGKTDSYVRIDVDSGIHWLEFKPMLQNMSGETFEIRYIDFYNNTITDEEGTLHLVKKEEAEKLLKLTRYAQLAGKNYRVPSGNFFLIDVLFYNRMQSVPELDKALASAQKLKQFKEIPAQEISSNFLGQLRCYQESGVHWLFFLLRYNLSGCLADDMGLGKTVQTLALLQTLKDKDMLNTSLLVVPVSAIPNWEEETKRFTPAITMFRHMGINRKDKMQTWKEYDLIITSYHTLRNDIEIFKDFHFDYVILDESQAIKNTTSQVTKAVKVLHGDHRLALSGTPIENTSMELWSLMDFLIPGYLGNANWFRSEWAGPVEKYKDQGKADLLKQMVYPFILRRKKENVEKDLPEKVEIVETLDMGEEQMVLYAATARHYSEIVEQAMDEEGVANASFKILEGMLRLRQICLFPQLVAPQYKGIPSVKFDHFSRMLEDILAEGHKVLVFSQFVSVLSIIKDHFHEKSINYAYIDGSVPVNKRGEMVKRFQQDRSTNVFLLSLKAGGVALNLTAADYVIIFDPWWNPAVEAQAIDRSHRIGQTKNVFVYRMVVKHSIEEKMLALQNQKKELVEKLITSEAKGFKDLTRDDILKLFN